MDLRDLVRVWNSVLLDQVRIGSGLSPCFLIPFRIHFLVVVDDGNVHRRLGSTDDLLDDTWPSQQHHPTPVTLLCILSHTFFVFLISSVLRNHLYHFPVK